MAHQRSSKEKHWHSSTHGDYRKICAVKDQQSWSKESAVATCVWSKKVEVKHDETRFSQFILILQLFMLQSVFSTTSWCRPRLAHLFVVPSSPHCYIGLKSYCLRLDLWLWRILFVAFVLSSYVTKRSLRRAAKIEPALSIVSRFATICHISEKCLSYLVIMWPHWGQGQL